MINSVTLPLEYFRMTPDVAQKVDFFLKDVQELTRKSIIELLVRVKLFEYLRLGLELGLC